MKHRKERLKRKINSLSDQKQPNTEPLTHTQFKSYKERGTEKNVNSSQILPKLVNARQGTTDWFKIEKRLCQGCVLSPCLFNLYAEYIMWNDKLDESQAGIKIAGRNINNFRYTDDTTLMAESKEELKSLFDEGERREWKSWLKTQLSQNRSCHLVPSLHDK